MDTIGIVAAVAALILLVGQFSGFVLSSRHARSLGQMLTVTKASSEATRRIAEAVGKSITAIERPYLLVDHVSWIDPALRSSNEITRPSAEVCLKNYGRTPALVQELCISLELLQTNQDALVIRVEPLDKVMVIGPQASWPCRCSYTKPIGDNARSQIDSGGLQFWVFVSILYGDMLGDQHQTRMRFRRSNGVFSMLRRDEYTITT